MYVILLTHDEKYIHIKSQCIAPSNNIYENHQQLIRDKIASNTKVYGSLIRYFSMISGNQL